jgi:hypothetical protein
MRRGARRGGGDGHCSGTPAFRRPSRTGSIWARYVGSSLIADQAPPAREREKAGLSARPIFTAESARQGDGDARVRTQTENAGAENFGWLRSPVDTTRPPVRKAKKELCEACVIHPDVSRRIARTEAQGLDDMSLRFFCAPDESLTNSDGEMRVGKISIQRQRMFPFSEARRSPLGEYVDESQCHMAERMVRD